MDRVYSYIRFNLLGWIPAEIFHLMKYLVGTAVIVCTVLIVERAAFPESQGLWAKAKSFTTTLNRTTYWGYRYLTHTNAQELQEPARRAAGTLDGMTEDGEVLLRIYAGGNIYQIQAVLADVDIRNIVDAATTVNQYQRQRVTVDYYQIIASGDSEEDGQVVVWLMDGNPLNEVLILNGSADATPTPPVNIVNRLMYSYYRRKMRTFFSTS